MLPKTTYWTLPLLTVLLTGVGSTRSLGQAFWISGDDVVQSCAGDQSEPSISFSGHSFLVVWSDTRANPYGTYDYETGRDIYGIRLSITGVPLSTLTKIDEADTATGGMAAFPIFQGKGAQSKPKVAWNGSSWLVVFENVQNNGTGYFDTGLMAVRVSGEGDVLDSRPIRFFGLKQSGFGWALGSDGNNWMLVNQGNAASNNVVGMRIAPNGVVLDPPNRTLIPQTYFMRTNFQLAFAQGNFMLLCTGPNGNGSDGMVATRFDSNLNILSGPSLALPGISSGLSSNGSQFLAVRSEQLPTFTQAVTVTRFNSLGQRLDANGIVLSTVGSAPTGAIAADWDGTHWKVFWATATGVRATRVTSAGSVESPGGLPVSGVNLGAMASNRQGDFLNVAVRYENWNNDVVSTFITSANNSAGEVPLSTSAPQHVGIEIAKGSSGAMSSFISRTANTHSIMIQPMTPQGWATGSPIALAQLAPTANPSEPRIAASGDTYLVTWGDNSGIRAARLDSQGHVLGAIQTILPSHFGPASVASQAGTFLVVARRYGSTPQVILTQAVRVRATDGQVLDSPPLGTGGFYVSRPPVVVPHNGGWLVAYLSNWSHNDSNASAALSFVPASGLPVNSVGTHTFSTAGGNGIFEIGLASNGSRALFVIPQELTSGVENDLRAQFIDGNLGLTPAFNITPWRGNQYRPSVAWDGSHFVVAFQDQRTRLLSDSLDPLDARSDIFGMRIAPNGQILDPDGFVLSVSDLSETDPRVAMLDDVVAFGLSSMNNGSSFANLRNLVLLHSRTGDLHPVARIQASPLSGNLPLTVNFSSNGSNDPDGKSVSYRWYLGDGSTSNSQNPSHTYTSVGPFKVILVVTDMAGNKTTQVMVVDPQPANQAPIAAILGIPSSGQAPLDIVASGENSYDPDGQLGNLRWRLNGANESWGGTGYYTLSNPGTYTVELTVWDNVGAQTTVSKTVTVTP